MSVDDVLSASSDRPWRRYLTTPLFPLFWLARTTRRATRALARRLGVHHHSPWLARRLGLRYGVDYGFSHAELVRVADDELVMGPGQPGKILEDALAEVTTHDPDSWRADAALLRFLARFEAEWLADRGRDALDTFQARTRTVARRIVDALPDRGAGDENA